MSPDYDRSNVARRILGLAGKYDAVGNLVGVAVGTDANNVTVDAATMVRLLDNADRLRAARDAALASPECPVESGLPDPCTLCAEPADGTCGIDTVRMWQHRAISAEAALAFQEGVVTLDGERFAVLTSPSTVAPCLMRLSAVEYHRALRLFVVPCQPEATP